MDKKIILWYDKDGDVLDVSLGAPVSSVSEEISNDVFVRRNERTGSITGFMLVNFGKRWADKRARELPITGTFKLVGSRASRRSFSVEI